ncbi:hypothetical protein NEMIN01_2521, partial [Nematocida minor]|uniref:uncharacterized protein n=1 Tax=Nematocida minor TaxID=1912983 RepID=UPI002220B153
LMLVYEKHYEMGKLIKLVKAMEENFEDPVDIVKEIKKVLTFDDLQIVVSISNNLAKIRYEKGISKHMIKAIEYMAENTSFLKGKNETMALEIDKSLNGFYESYITNGCLENTIYRRKNEITEEIAGDSELLSKECEKYNKKRLQKLIEISGARFENDELDESRAITYLKNKIDALEWKLKKEDLQSKKTHELLYTERFLSEISPAQKNYMFRKMEEFANARKIKVLEARKPFLAELLSTSSRLQKLILILSIIFFIFGFVLFIEIY